jgi:predicted nucleic acid-binding protein
VIRAVLDTNVIVASLAAVDGGLARLTEHWPDRRFELVTSDFILTETERAWNKR